MIHELADLVAVGFELTGMAVIVLGVVVALIPYGPGPRRPLEYLHGFRRRLGQAIVLGLEFLVAADILRTISTAPTLMNVATLAGIVLIRTFLSFSLEVELEGRWPWQRPAARQPEPRA